MLSLVLMRWWKISISTNPDFRNFMYGQMVSLKVEQKTCDCHDLEVEGVLAGGLVALKAMSNNGFTTCG
jgi:hypothetical protein